MSSSRTPARTDPGPGRAYTFVFADLAGFTALTEAEGDDAAAELAADFCEKVRAVLPLHGAHQVKTIGDAVMIRADDAVGAVRLGLALVHDLGMRHGLPAIRVGMHTGTAVERAGDWFGATVNLAARVSAAAGGCEVLLTDATRLAAGPLEAIELRDHGRHRLKNVSEEVQLYAAVPLWAETSRGHAVDPVCRMALEGGGIVGTILYQGVRYDFCSLVCIGRFAEAPERFCAQVPDA